MALNVTYRPVKVSLPKTMAKYGMVEADWLALYNHQKGRCAICLQRPPKGRMVIDHEHVKGWAKMPPEERKQYVRGLLCWTCNHYCVGRGVTLFRAQRAALYLEAYDQRRPK